jgi:hypothetical protein
MLRELIKSFLSCAIASSLSSLPMLLEIPLRIPLLFPESPELSEVGYHAAATVSGKDCIKRAIKSSQVVSEATRCFLLFAFLKFRICIFFSS